MPRYDRNPEKLPLTSTLCIFRLSANTAMVVPAGMAPSSSRKGRVEKTRQRLSEAWHCMGGDDRNTIAADPGQKLERVDLVEEIFRKGLENPFAAADCHDKSPHGVEGICHRLWYQISVADSNCNDL
jgi:hypothetical protein